MTHAFCSPSLQLYRLEKFDESSRCYRKLMRGVKDERTEERETNYLAAVAGASQKSGAPTWQVRLTPIPTSFTLLILFSCSSQRLPVDSQSYETLYNASCCQLAVGQVKEADQLLERAKGSWELP